MSYFCKPKKTEDFYILTNETLKVVGPILFVTAAGGVLGKVIASSSLVGYITEHAAVLKTVGIFFPFLLAAILKSAQGSSTVAITTTAGILAPLMAPRPCYRSSIGLNRYGNRSRSNDRFSCK